ncbi:MAG: hypothetical protein A2848_00490 [Candidatus Magasanikbacteria bacterium RIFCSPHIGHO2_01_FULL_50_8]|uniref:Uncharacterized protein n=1 Tax=Candidatus Magasanikbacteria bacterium RIFCSPHIGHO2_01_FULL_50_8 TaxID=1798674 RepID=A0A1F6LU19_9BACT|nr:MAG: hypothetical protein A2848_00490 [Candidatus Magasanikbacteria bacterium RIFCSPHIGHO2_01_FULL_50_8]
MMTPEFSVRGVDPPKPKYVKFKMQLWLDATLLEEHETDTGMSDPAIWSLVDSWRRRHGFDATVTQFLRAELQQVRDVRR